MSALPAFASLLVLLPAAAQAWDVVPGPDPALWVHSRTPLENPDPRAVPPLRRAPALLSVQCQGGQKVAFVNHNFEVEPNSALVSTSVDGAAAVTETWRDDTGVALEPPDAVGFVARLRGHRTLTMTVTWPGAAPTGTVFDVAGTAAALAPLHRACGW